MSAGGAGRPRGRPEVEVLPLYATDAAECAVDVSDNTNLWGMAPAARRAMEETVVRGVSRYPSLYSAPLRESILRHLGLSGGEMDVVVGCGSDDVIDSAMRAFGGPGRRIAFSTPTFSMIPVFAGLNGMEAVAVPFAAGFDADVDRLLDTRADITYLCTPNNPTATPLSRAAVERVIAGAAGVVLIDEAYAEFAPERFGDLAARSDRVLVTRTFSKAFGLAGLRVGYGFGARVLVDLVARARGPYKVNIVGEAAALASLAGGDDALSWVERHARLAVESRDRLVAELRALGLEPLPSAANFVYVPTPHAAALARWMRERGVLVRAFGVDTGAPALRIGVGPWPMMAQLLDTLRDGVAACE